MLKSVVTKVVSRFRLKAPPGISSSSISPLTSSGQRSRASWSSQTQKSATLSPQPGGKPRTFIRICGGIGGGESFLNPKLSRYKPLSRKYTFSLIHNSFILLNHLCFMLSKDLPESVTRAGFPLRNNSPQWARASSLPRLPDHTQTHHTR